MPDFMLEPQVLPTFKTVAWKDPPSLSRPSRVTTTLGRSRFAWQVQVNTQFQVWARPDGGAAGDPDTVLGGRLFTAWFAESPELPVSPSYSVGYSGRIYFTPTLIGHIVLVVRRKDGGAVVLHIDCVDPDLPVPP